MSTDKSTKHAVSSRSLMWVVIVIFAVQIAVWTAWITFASKHRVAEVPLVTTR